MSAKSRNEMFQGVTARVLWGAAAYADRMNKGVYVKADHDAYHDSWSDRDVPASVSNKTYAKRAIATQHLIGVEDFAKGEEIRRYFKGLTFKAMMGNLNDFEQNVLKFVDIEDFSDDRNAAYHLAICASLPASHRRAMEREQVDATIRDAHSQAMGAVGDKVEFDCEVLRTVHSEKYQTNFITVITADKNVAFFAYKKSYESGTRLHVKGKIKRLLDNGETQLNYAKVTVL